MGSRAGRAGGGSCQRRSERLVVDRQQACYCAQLLLLGISFMVIATVFDSLYAFAAGNAGSWLSKSRVRFVEVSSGLCLIGGGLWMALRGR